MLFSIDWRYEKYSIRSLGLSHDDRGYFTEAMRGGGVEAWQTVIKVQGVIARRDISSAI
jgi:hypothetical protein